MSIKSKVLGVRIDQATEKRLERFQTVTKVEAVTLARAALGHTSTKTTSNSYLSDALR